MRYGIIILALGLVGSSQVSAGDLQSVYVAPGGVYIASANVHDKLSPTSLERLFKPSPLTLVHRAQDSGVDGQQSKSISLQFKKRGSLGANFQVIETP